MNLIRFLLRLLCALAFGATCLAAAAAQQTSRVVPEKFLPQLTAQLSTHFAVDGELQLDLLRSWNSPAVRTDDWEMVVVAPPRALASQVIVHVKLLADGRNVGEWNLPLRVQLWQDALVAKQPIARGQLLDAHLFDLRRTDVIRDKEAIPAGTELASLTVARTVGIGSVLTWRDVTRRNLVERGDRIEVVATDGQLSITLKALAMQSGALGDTIVVRNTESRRDFSAVVTSENQARVTF